MKTIQHVNRLIPSRRLILVLLTVAWMILLTACNQALAPILGQGDTNHVQQFTTFLEDLAHEALAAYLF